MTESREIRRLRERIAHQRERLGRDPAIGAAPATAVPTDHERGPAEAGRRTSVPATLARLLAEHPALAVGLGTVVLVAGPGRSLRLARHAVRATVLLLAAWRGASALLELLPAEARRDDPVDAVPGPRAQEPRA